MKKLVITQPMGLSHDQLSDLKKIFDVRCFDTISENTEQWLSRVEGAELIYTNIKGIDYAWRSLKNVFVTLPFVGMGWLDIDVLKANNVVVSNSPGCNRVAVSEWIVAMLLDYSRNFSGYVKTNEISGPIPPKTKSLHGKTVCIIGKGRIGLRTGRVLSAMGMIVTYSIRGDILADKILHADYIIDCLSLNESTFGFYDYRFFEKVKHGVVFVSISPNQTQDMQAILNGLETSKIEHYITDNAASIIFDTHDETYKKLKTNNQIIITPHIAAYSDITVKAASKICIENLKAYNAGKPQNTIY